MIWTLSVPTFASSEAPSHCCVFHCCLEFLYSGDHHVLLHSPPGLMWSSAFCLSITSGSRLLMLTAFLPPPDLRCSQLCTGHHKALVQHGATERGRSILVINTTASATGMTGKAGHCICSYTERCPPQQTTERARTMDGQTSACSGQLRPAQLWCLAWHTWPFHGACGYDWCFPRDIRNPITPNEATQSWLFSAMQVTGRPQAS